MATEHLLNLGHLRIGMIGGGQETTASKRRREGFYAALKEHEITLDESLVMDCETTPAGGEAAILR